MSFMSVSSFLHSHPSLSHPELTPFLYRLGDFGEAWYYSKERVSGRFTEEECKKGENWEQTYKKVSFSLALSGICFWWE